ncbi:hypothetical protein ALC53_04394, partial [Atta colombica]
DNEKKEEIMPLIKTQYNNVNKKKNDETMITTSFTNTIGISLIYLDITKHLNQIVGTAAKCEMV